MLEPCFWVRRQRTWPGTGKPLKSHSLLKIAFFSNDLDDFDDLEWTFFDIPGPWVRPPIAAGPDDVPEPQAQHGAAQFSPRMPQLPVTIEMPGGHWPLAMSLLLLNAYIRLALNCPWHPRPMLMFFSMDRGWLWDLSKCHAFHKLVTPCCTMLHLGGWACGALSSSSSFLGSPWKPLERGPRAACSILAPTPWAILHGCLGSISAAEWVQCLDTYTIDLMDSVMECVMDCVMHVIVPIKNFFICIWLYLYDSVLICHEFRRNEDIRAIRKSVETAILYGRSRLKPWTSFVNFWIINLGGKSGKKMVKGGYWDSLC